MAPRRARKRCAALDNLNPVVPRKRRKLAPNPGNDQILGSQQKRAKYTTADTPKKRRVTIKRKKQIAPGHVQNRGRSSCIANASDTTSQSHLSSCVEQMPAALDLNLIQDEVHELIKKLAMLKKNVTNVTPHSNIKITASSNSSTDQSVMVKETKYEEPTCFLRKYAKESEMNVDLVSQNIMEIIQQFIMLNLCSRTTPSDVDTVKKTIHEIINKYVNENEECGDNSEEDDTDTDSTYNYMDEEPGCSTWFYPK
ncbi:uncharacterized protein LOC119687070 isoform X2 [Teleopsis dalmanni]|uniref:uncharacterized protein LOC119687070 isoform X2 n=1 Tax=Teleopsis dalmanni TaxID=139649 RepID=UPI0018CD23CD|nr:uncharacterized protein LOC119687070 isoform X2 [Teleopsis dalmanni]